MFGRKKMYKKGMKDAMNAYVSFGEKQEQALEQIRKEIQAGQAKYEDMLSRLGDDILGVYDYLTSKEKEELYHLCTPTDISVLGEEERRLLIALLYQLADDEKQEYTEEQQKYIRSIQMYLGISNPQTSIDYETIERIDSIEYQKIFLQVVLEFFYLRASDEISDAQEAVLSYFSINKRQAEQMELYVSKVYNILGPEGLCEKYGSEIDDETDLDESELNPGRGNRFSKFYFKKVDHKYEIRLWETDDILVDLNSFRSIHETFWFDNIVAYAEKVTYADKVNENVYHVIDISTQKEKATIKAERLIAVSTSYYVTQKKVGNKKMWSVSDYKKRETYTFMFTVNDRIIGLTDQYLIIGINVLDTNEYIFYGDGEIICIDFKNKNKTVIKEYSNRQLNVAKVYDNKVFFTLDYFKNDGSNYGQNSELYCYDLESLQMKWKSNEKITPDFWSRDYVTSWGEDKGQAIIIHDNIGELFYGECEAIRVVFDCETGQIYSIDKIEDIGGSFKGLYVLDDVVVLLALSNNYLHYGDLGVDMDGLNLCFLYQWAVDCDGNSIADKIKKRTFS